VDLIDELIACPECCASNDLNNFDFLFDMHHCTVQFALGHKTMQCPRCKVQVLLERLIPDLSLTDVTVPRLSFADLEIKQVLGRGAFGVISEAKLPSGETVAVKQLLLKERNDSAEVLKVFKEFSREVWLMSKLQHPCVVNLKAFCMEDSSFALVMEKVKYGNLYDFLQKSSAADLSWSLVCRIALDVAQGVVRMKLWMKLMLLLGCC